MEIQLSFKVNPTLFLKDPESSEIGKSIVKNAIDLIFAIGYENLNFKKLAIYSSTTEATIYRYFPNKHKLLLYILNWYWSFLYYQSQIHLKSDQQAKDKLIFLLKLLTNNNLEDVHSTNFDLVKLYEIVIAESSKVYLVKEVDEINKDHVFKMYKELCAFVSEVILAYNPNYKYPKSLASTILETAHNQQFFSMHLPNLTDNRAEDHASYVFKYLENLVFGILNQKEK